VGVGLGLTGNQKMPKEKHDETRQTLPLVITFSASLSIVIELMKLQGIGMQLIKVEKEQPKPAMSEEEIMERLGV
jgi:hypothetical protein